ncbi:hypothetical protein ILUMI_19317 [Ignelater luminosus]|uniref:HTH psq-type domain-containing protein n=1 Tax=Ignelater luminosus TaxID=2038154 RepID=A0A8K0CKS0_IGNLU|nr:hypothetical protein ILUMI_19317 [Ignelater luminosus]
MGRYQKKSTRQSWTEQNMQQAIDAVKEKRMGWLLASTTYNVPFTTLRRRASSSKGCSMGYLGGHKVTFSKKKLETELVEHIKTLETRFFGLTTLDVRKLAFQIAEVKKIAHRFSRDKEVVGWNWLRGFTQQNPSISLRTLTKSKFKTTLNVYQMSSISIHSNQATYGMSMNLVCQQSYQKMLKPLQAKDGNKSEYQVVLKEINQSWDVSDISVANLSPISTASHRKRAITRKKGKDEVLNTTPEINLPKQIVAEKEAQALRKSVPCCEQTSGKG